MAVPSVGPQKLITLLLKVHYQRLSPFLRGGPLLQHTVCGLSVVSKGIACVLVFSVIPHHPRRHMSFCAGGWDVTLYRQSPDAVLDSQSVRLCSLCMHGVGDEKHLVFECSALNRIRLKFPHLFTGFHTMLSFTNHQRHVMHLIADCLRTQP